MRRAVLGILCGGVALPLFVSAQGSEELTPAGILKFPGFQLGTVIPEGSFSMRVGSTFSTEGDGTGTQSYSGGLTWRPAGWQATYGFEIQAFDDPPRMPVNGTTGNLTFAGLAFNSSFALREGPIWDAALHGSVGGFRYSQEIIDEDEDFVLARAALPVTYALSDQLTLTGAVSATVGPEEFGTVSGVGQRYAVGLGATFRPTNRLEFYGAAKALFREGDQFDDDGGDEIYTFGGRYALTADLALDVFATNAFSNTRILSDMVFPGEGGDAVIGVNLDYRPSRQGQSAPRFRHGAGPQPRTLAFGDGFSVLSPETVGTDRLRLVGGGHSGGQALAGFVISADPHWQYETYFEQYDLEDANPFRAGDDEGVRFLIGGRWQPLSEADGDPLSLGLHTLVGRDTGKPTVGVAYASLLAGRQIAPALYGRVNLATGLFGDDEITGLGSGLTLDLTERMQGIFEYTYVDGADEVISAGARYILPGDGMAIDVYATNAAGLRGIGGLLAQDDYSVGVSVSFDTDFELF
ncbi:MAG: hypothetical protein AAFQ54_08750 [Pseudomonadota bacterium]